MKKILSISAILLIPIVLCSCFLLLDGEYFPTRQYEEKSKWVSDDEKIELYCVNGYLEGYLNANGEKLVIYANITFGGRLEIYKYDGTTLPEDFEEWHESDQYIWVSEYHDSQVMYESGEGKYRKNSFTVKFDQTTYLEPGEKITFHKVEWTDLPEDLPVRTEVE